MCSYRFTVGSMFAGIGGIDLAFEQAGFKVVWANEIDKYACSTYRLNFGSEYLVESDIRCISASKIPDFNILVAGFPCQPFSSAGLQKGFHDPRGNLFFEIIRVITKKKPEIIFFENVANLIKHNNGKTFNVIKTEIENLNYFLTYKIMNASDYSIPQQRNRIYILASKNKQFVKRFSFPTPRPLDRDAFFYLNKERQEKHYYMDNHKKWTEMISYMTDRTRIYRFTDWGLSKSRPGICPTLLAAMGGPYERIPFFFDDFSVRTITEIETARLQGFPENYHFQWAMDSKQIYKQIGNSVCIPVIKEIAERVRKVLEEVGND